MSIQQVIIEHTDEDAPSSDPQRLAAASIVFLLHSDRTVTVWKYRDGPAIIRVDRSELASELQLALSEGLKQGWAGADQFSFEGEGSSMLARELLDRGLLFLLNHAVLHNYGYAVGVDMEADGVNVKGLVIYRSDDPEGIVYDDQTFKEGREKLRRAGLR